MVDATESSPGGNPGRNFAADQGTADLLRAGSAEVITTVAEGSTTPDQATELILCCDLWAIDQQQPIRRTCAPPCLELCFRLCDSLSLKNLVWSKLRGYSTSRANPMFLIRVEMI